MHGRWERVGMGEHQLAHVLAGDTDEVRDVRKADEVGGRFDEGRIRNCGSHVGKGGLKCLQRALRFPVELQCQVTALPDPDQRVVATRLGQTLDQFVRFLIAIGQLVSERKGSS